MKYSLIALSALAVGMATPACANHHENKHHDKAHHGMDEKGHHEKMAKHGPWTIETASQQSFDATLADLTSAIDEKGFRTFAVIDHAAGAASIDAELRATTLVIFGNPKGGTPLLQAAQTIGIDLPLKALVYENADGDVVIAMTDIKKVVAHHGLDPASKRATAISGVLQGLADAAARAE